MKCPNCQNEQVVTEQHYGALFTCSSCQAVYFINFEGQPEYSTDIPETVDVAQFESQNQSQQQPVNDPSTQALETADASVAQPETSFETQLGQSSSEISNTNDFNQIPMQDFNLAASSDSPNQDLNNLNQNSDAIQPIEQINDGQPNQDLLQDFNAVASDAINNVAAAPPPSSDASTMPEVDMSNPDVNPFEAVQTQAEVSPAKTFKDIAGEISEFGNTEVQLAGLNYDLKISGIDTQETMKLFIEAIQDSKFGWDHNEIVKTIKNGSVEFLKLSPVKAYILAKRIQFLDVEKQWSQNVMS